MRAWVVDRPGPMASRPLRLTDRPVPEPGPGELLVRVICCGVCRTDLHLAEGDLAPRAPGITPGHEVVGEVAATGPGPARFQPGDRVGVAWLAGTDGTCRYCRRGAENLCPASVYTGWDRHGGYAEYLTAADAFVHPLPDGFSDIEIAPLLCAGIIGYRALRRAQVPPGGTLGIWGFGGSAHLAAQIAMGQGAEVHVFTRARPPASWRWGWAPRPRRTPSTRPRSRWTRRSSSPRPGSWCPPPWPPWTGAAPAPSPGST